MLAKWKCYIFLKCFKEQSDKSMLPAKKKKSKKKKRRKKDLGMYDDVKECLGSSIKQIPTKL